MSQPSSPTDTAVTELTTGLITYVRALLSRSPQQQVRNAIGGNDHVWLHAYRQHLQAENPRCLVEIEFLPAAGPPVPPAELAGWITELPDDPAGPVPTLIPDENTETTPTVRRTYAAWLAQWRSWAQEEKQAASARDAYTQLERLGRKTEQLADTHELVLGVGLLTVAAEGVWTVYRHLLTIDAAIVVDPDSDAVRVELPLNLRIRREDQDFLAGMTPFHRERASSAQFDTALEDLEGPLSPALDAWLQRWGRNCWTPALTPATDQWTQPEGADVAEAKLCLAPALILRRRDRGGLADFYDRIGEDLRRPGATAPVGLAQLVVALHPEQRLRWLSETSVATAAPPDADPLLPLAANDEQRDVLHVLRHDTAAVVQGPPGTGKTHTIANLICALLADGHRILITSQKSQALQVLRKKLPEAVQDLCVLMSGLQRGGIDELDRSITRLSDLQASTNLDRLRQEIEELRHERTRLQGHIRRVMADLHTVRGQEYAYHPVAADRYAGTLRDLVSAIRADRERHEWIGDLPAGADARSPISDDQALTLLRLLRDAAPERAARNDQVLPDDHELVGVNELVDAVADITAAANHLGADADLAGTLVDLDPQVLDQLRRPIDDAADALAAGGLGELTATWDDTDWRLPAVQALFSRRNPAYWQALFDEVSHALQHDDVVAAATGPEVSIEPAPASGADRARLLGQARRLHDYLARGGRIRRCLPAQEQAEAAEFLRACLVSGATPTTHARVAAAITYLHAETVITAALDEWSGKGVPVAAGNLRQRIAQLRDIDSSVQATKALITARETVEAILRGAGVRHHLRTAAHWDAVVRVVRATPLMTRARLGRRLLAEAVRNLTALARHPAAAPETALLAAAISGQDAAAYTAARDQLAAARRDQRAEQQYRMLMSKLSAAHPELATRLCSTALHPHWPSRLAGLEAAWSWAAACAYHRLVQRMDSERDYEQALAQAELQLSTVTGRLAGKQALWHCLTRITPEQRQALQAYRSHVARYGKGHSSQKHRQSAAIRDAMKSAQAAVPAWVMPLTVVAETLPREPGTFDVVIVDEASQAGLDAIFLLWLAPRMIVVGDDKQCAPPPGSDLEDAAALRDRHLAALPPRLREGFEPGMNLYELLAARFPKVIRLSEHFRSMPEIIGWSSNLFYDRRLVPLRQFGADRLQPLKVVTIDDAVTEGSTDLRNRSEAEAIADTVQKLVDDPANSKMTIGVITLAQGNRQATLIENLIGERVDPAVARRHRIQVGQPPDFQGDERHIILLSMVVAPARNRARVPLTTRTHQRRFNVAVTRARDQLWLFTSVRPSDLKTDDLRHMLLTYMLHPPATLEPDSRHDDTTRDARRPPFESLFEQRVFLDLRSRGFDVLPHYAVGRHYLDLVVVGDRGRLAVECETPDKRATPEQLRERLYRERELRRAEWQLHRIRESQYLVDPANALEPLWQRLHDLQIEPRTLAPAAAEAVHWTPGVLSDDEDDS
ncbi:very short patch repair endonuclease [Paractinoplanes abujensis]|nr:very short patch repair endonuclease [Actinoplanes abujensis]